MQQAGLRFIADGGEQFLKTIQNIERAGARLDKVLLALAKTSEALDRSVRSGATAFQSINRTLDATARRFQTIDRAMTDVGRRMPTIANAIQRGFAGGSMESFFRQQGVTLARAFITGVEGELGIRSPSRVMMRIGQDTGRGFIAGLEAIGWAATGVQMAASFVTSFGRAALDGARQVAGQIRQAFERALREVESAFRSAGQRLQQTGMGMMQGGLRTVTAGGVMALATAAPIALPLNSAIEFEQTMTNTRALLGQTREEMRDLNAEVLALGSTSVAGPEAAAAAFYDIVSGVQDATQHMAILQNSISLSEAGQAALTATTSGLVSVMNAYGAANITATRASDVYARTVGMGVGTMDQFVSAMAPISGLAATLNIDFAEMGSAMAFMTAQGATASAAATQMQAAMVALLRPSGEMQRALQAAGFASGQAAIEQLGLVGALHAVNDALDGDQARMAAALGSVEALRASVALLKDEYSEFNAEYEAGLDGATERARAIQLEGAYARIKLLRNAMKGLAISVGDELLPPVVALVDSITPLVNGLREWIQNNSELAGSVIRVAAGAAFIVAGLTTLGGIISIVTGALTFGLGGGLIAVANGLGLVTSLLFNPMGVVAGLASTGAAAMALVPVFLAVGAAIAAIGVVIHDIRNNVGGAGDAFASLRDSVGGLLVAFGGLMGDVATLVGYIFSTGPALERTFSPVTGVLQRIDALVQGLTNRIGTLRDFLQFAGAAGITGGQQEVARNEEINRLQRERSELLGDIYRMEQGIVQSGGESVRHTIQQGDTLHELARRYGTTVEALKEANNLQNDLIIAGQELVISGAVEVDIDTSEAQAELDEMRSRLLDLDGDLSQLESERQISLGTVQDIRPELDRLRDGVALVKQAFGEFLSGDFLTGFDTLRTGVSEITGAVRDLWSAFKGSNAAGDTGAVGGALLAGFSEVGIQVDTGGSAGLDGQLRAQLAGLTTLDLSSVQQGITTQITTTISGGLSAAANFDYSSAATGIATAIGDAVNGVWETFNVDVDSSQITSAVSDAMDGVAGHDFSTIEQALADNLSAVIRAGMALVGMVLGGPAGIALGLAGLVAAAIESDFLGIGTALEESGIKAEIETAANNVLDQIKEAFSFDFSGEGEITIVDDILAFLAPLGEALTGDAAESYINSLGVLGSGIIGFVSNLADTDISGFVEAGQAVATFVRDVLALGVRITLAGGAGVIEGIGRALPLLGEGISSIVSAASNLLQGNVGEALTGLSSGIQRLKDGLGEIGIGAVDGLINVINELTGLELPDLRTGIQALVDGLEMAWLALRLIVDNIKRTVETFFLELQLAFFSGLAQFVAPLREIGIDIGGDIEFRVGDIQRQLADRALDDQIRAALSTEGLRASVPVVLDVTPEGIEITREVGVMDMVASPSAVAEMSMATRLAAEDAVKQGLQEVDASAADLRLMLTGAENLDVDLGEVDLSGALNTLLDDAIALGMPDLFTDDLGAMLAQGLDLDATRESLTEQIKAALTAGDTETVIDLANLGIALDLDTDSIFAEDPVNWGSSVGQALAEGLAEANVEMEDAGLAAGEALKQGMNSALGISSPSTFGIAVGGFVAEGIIAGMAGLGGRFAAAVEPVIAALRLIPAAANEAAAGIQAAGGMMTGALGQVRGVAEGVLQLVSQLKNEMMGLGFAVIQDIPGLNAAPPPGGIPGRARGGPIRAGNWYEVNEEGSEVAVIGGRTFLLPNADGYVIPPREVSAGDVLPASAALGGGGGSSVNVQWGDVQIIVPEDVGSPDDLRDAVFAALEEYGRSRTPDEIFRDVL